MINFVLVAAVLFMLLRSVNRVIERREREEPDGASTAAAVQLPTNPKPIC